MLAQKILFNPPSTIISIEIYSISTPEFIEYIDFKIYVLHISFCCILNIFDFSTKFTFCFSEFSCYFTFTTLCRRLKEWQPRQWCNRFYSWSFLWDGRRRLFWIHKWRNYFWIRLVLKAYNTMCYYSIFQCLSNVQ